jgi:hypothetical protein
MFNRPINTREPTVELTDTQVQRMLEAGATPRSPQALIPGSRMLWRRRRARRYA